MYGARPDGRGVGVTETPPIGLPATQVMDAKLGKCGHCEWTRSWASVDIVIGRRYASIAYRWEGSCT